MNYFARIGSLILEKGIYGTWQRAFAYVETVLMG